ncbi:MULTISPECIES: HAD hydrolase-like protein [Mycobacteriaceae]|uniref:HAD hydrolase-like protein n=1 Tax=Mycobacteriaceae TaxID=1762 RepID=UPI0007FC44BD|nr:MULTISPECIES: HAD family hydrolase [Mycobacteriaceae]MCK0173655.1 HAD hydrolase-like protein [Mycolicibacterium sp. F2034L]OBB57263.1 haloacid dehalogenase [Mycobacterium sp. 852013-51886_SCH5428379]
MSTTEQRTWCAGRFWWGPAEQNASPVRALIFDLDALADLERDAHRVVFNAAFAAHGLPIEWSVARYRQLLVLRDERQRVLAELRKHCVGPECDVLTELLADEVCATKTIMFDEMVVDAELSPRAGLTDLMNEAFAADIPVAVVTAGRRSWAEPLIRQLVGEGLVEVIVTADDVTTPGADPYRQALAELGVWPQHAVAFAGSSRGLRMAGSAELATVLVGASAGAARDASTAMAVVADYAGAVPLTLAALGRMRGRWPAAQTNSAA